MSGVLNLQRDVQSSVAHCSGNCNECLSFVDANWSSAQTLTDSPQFVEAVIVIAATMLANSAG